MPTDIKSVLANPAAHWPRVIEALNSEVLPRVVQRMNEEMSIHQIAKLTVERLPENERNLTDARTRIGVLLEYSLAVYMDRYVTEVVGLNHRVGFVVAHKFPDLVSRDPDHLPVLRIEVKCIQSAAEEKSANLDALIRDIRPMHDVLCVLAWEWKDAKRGNSPIEYPHVYRGFAFDAYTIAKVRDWGWLNEPKPARRNDIDVASAVVGQGGSWKKEEKNLGKLMRIADLKALEKPPLVGFSKDPNVIEYGKFKKYVIELAISQCWKRIAKKIGWTIQTDHECTYTEKPARLGTAVDAQGKPITIFFGPTLRWSANVRSAVFDDLKAQGTASCRVVLLGVKFSWILADYDGQSLDFAMGGKKPGGLVNELVKPATH